MSIDVVQYLCGSWQGMLQLVVYLMGRGYYYHCVSYYPESKRDKWPNIDRKIMNKYPCGLSKDQRYRRKKLKQANYHFVRWENCALILMTEGEHGALDDRFIDAREQPLYFRISPPVEFKIDPAKVKKEGKGERMGIMVHLSRESYLGCKANLREALERDLSKSQIPNASRHLIKEFEKLNGLPCWGGVIEQKRRLLLWLLGEAKRHGIRLRAADFHVLTKRKIFLVWSEQDSASQLK